jgi:hypothetical protein
MGEDDFLILRNPYGLDLFSHRQDSSKEASVPNRINLSRPPKPVIPQWRKRRVIDWGISGKLAFKVGRNSREQAYDFICVVVKHVILDWKREDISVTPARDIFNSPLKRN